MLILVFMLFLLGIGVGFLLCEWMLGKWVEIGLVLLGVFGFIVFGVDLYLVCLGVVV